MAGAVLLVTVAAAAFVLYAWVDTPRHVKVAPPDIRLERTPERIARGREIVVNLCVGCHYDQRTGALTGRRVVDAPPELGVFNSRNITQHPTRGIGRWTDGELVYLLRTGVERDGVFPGPFMAHPHASDEDIASVVAFLRSDDPLVQPKDTPNQPSKPSLLAKVLLHTVFQPSPFPKERIAAPDRSDKVAYGRYLATALLDCYACHSADFKTMNSNFPEKSVGFFGGGNPLRDVDGHVVASANLTPDPETGIGNWSQTQFVRALREGFRPDNRPLRYPMTVFDLSDEEAGAIYAYLRTVPALRRPLDRWSSKDVLPASASLGQKVYQKYYCGSCHGASGVGACDLRGAYDKYKDRDGVAAFIHNPSKFVPGTKMPTWQGIILEEEYGPLADYLRVLGGPSSR